MFGRAQRICMFISDGHQRLCKSSLEAWAEFGTIPVSQSLVIRHKPVVGRIVPFFYLQHS
jgi:hypothetical protein